MTLLTARYAYARVKMQWRGLECIVGIEIEKNGSEIVPSYSLIRNRLEMAFRNSILADDSPFEIAAIIEATIRLHPELWTPGRSYFIEIGEENEDGNVDEWVQVFEPHQHNQ